MAWRRCPLKPAMMQLTPEAIREVVEIDLKIVAPVHIGTREGRLSALEFIFCDGQTHIIDDERLGGFLKTRQAIDHFINSVRSGRVNLAEFLQRTAKVDPSKVAKEIAGTSIPGGAASMTEFRPYVRDGNGQVFIPGSSIKGVFRTALLWGILERDAGKKQALERVVSRDFSGSERMSEGRKRFYSASMLQEDLLQKFDLPKGRVGPNQDLLRCLSFRDAYPVGKVETRVIKIQFLSKRKNGDFYWSAKKRGGQDTGGQLEVWLDALLSGTFRTQAIWDHRIFEHFQKNNPRVDMPVKCLDDVLSALSGMFSSISQHEESFFSSSAMADRRGAGGYGPEPTALAASRLKQWYATGGKNARIGFGSGMLCTTINTHFPHELREKIRDACGHPRPGDPAPKSRRIWRGLNESWLPMGWVLIGKSREVAVNTGILVKEASPVVKPAEVLEKPIPPVQTTKAVIEVEKVTLKNLLRDLQTARATDRLAMERFVEAMDELQEDAEMKQFAEALHRKLKEAGIWDKHPLRKRIEVFIS